MKNTKSLGLIAIVAVIMLAFTACEDPSAPPKDKELSGTVTISPAGPIATGTKLTASYSGSEIVSYQWNKDSAAIPGAASTEYTPDAAGSYTVTASAKGYKSKTSLAVTVGSGELELSGTVTISPNENVKVDTKLTAGYNGPETVTLAWQWNKDGVAISGVTSIEYTPSETGRYTVTASAAGYKSKNSAEVEVTAITTSGIPITNAEISIVAPVKDMTPAATATGTGYFTAGTVSWSPADSPFKGGVVYTATVTLTADAGHTFTGLNNATVNGQPADVSHNIGAAVTLSHAFPKTDTRTATALAIKTQPSKLTYTHGDTLDLAGLEITLSFDDSSTDDLFAANFADHNITANPAHGDHLFHLTHNGHPVTVEYGNLEKDTGNLTVSPKVITFTVDAIPAVDYTGTAHTPTIIVRDGTIELTITADYTVAYSDNTNAGTATVTITGAGNYAGSTGSATFAIKQEAELSVTFDQITEAVPLISGHALSKSGTATATLTVTDPGQYSSIEWYIDGSLRRSGATFTLNAANYAVGSHIITLEVVKGGVSYNQTITFTVEN